MISSPLLGLNLTRRNRRLMLKLAKKFWNVYSNVLKKNNRFSTNALTTTSVNSNNGTNPSFLFNNPNQNILIEHGFLLADGGRTPPKGFEKYFPGGEKKKSENESKPDTASNNKPKADVNKKFEFELKFGGSKKNGNSSSNDEEK